jgi:1,4-dihydroxy-2-naphthoyl-CoA hydrolase
MAFLYHRTVRFADTDAAGVVYFANVLNLCHEAYEASLAAAGIDLHPFFTQSHLAIPIVATDAKFLHPLRCGDSLVIQLIPTLTGADSFSLAYTLALASNLEVNVALATTKHVCILPQQRQRQPLPPDILAWLEQTK